MQLTIDHGKHENRPKGEERPTNGHLWLEKYQLLILGYLPKVNYKLTIAPVVNALASASSFMITLTQGNKIGVTAEVNPRK